MSTKENLRLEDFRIASATEYIAEQLQNDPDSIKGYGENKHLRVLIFDHQDKSIVGGGNDPDQIEDDLFDKYGENYFTRFLVWERNLG